MTTEQNEQQQLAGLEERYQWTKSQLESYLPMNRQVTLAEIQRAVDYTQQLVDWFRTNYGPTANSLQAAGFSQLADRLNAIIADFQQSHTIYVSMYQEKMQPPPPPNFSPTSNILDEMNHRNEVFRASFTNQCWNCQLQFGAEEFLRLVYCPRCNAMLYQ